MVRKTPKIFVSYAKEDEHFAKALQQDLSAAGADPWFDKKKLLPGQHWDSTIHQAISQSDFFIALLSNRSVNKRGYVQQELREGLKNLDKMPEGAIYLIPARLDECEPSFQRLKELHWVDLFPSWEQGLSKILLAIQLGANLPPVNSATKPLISSIGSSRREERMDDGVNTTIKQPIPSIKLEISDEAMQEIEKLKAITGETKTSVIYNTLTLLNYVINSEKNGRLIIERQGPEGKELKEVILSE